MTRHSAQSAAGTAITDAHERSRHLNFRLSIGQGYTAVVAIDREHLPREHLRPPPRRPDEEPFCFEMPKLADLNG